MDPNYPKRLFSFESREDGCELGVWGSQVKIIVENTLKSIGCVLQASGHDV